MVKIVAEYVCHPRQFKSSVLMCMKKFPQSFTIFHLLLMQSGDSRILVISTTISISTLLQLLVTKRDHLILTGIRTIDGWNTLYRMVQNFVILADFLQQLHCLLIHLLVPGLGTGNMQLVNQECC